MSGWNFFHFLFFHKNEFRSFLILKKHKFEFTSSARGFDVCCQFVQNNQVVQGGNEILSPGAALTSHKNACNLKTQKPKWNLSLHFYHVPLWVLISEIASRDWARDKWKQHGFCQWFVHQDIVWRDINVNYAKLWKFNPQASDLSYNFLWCLMCFICTKFFVCWTNWNLRLSLSSKTPVYQDNLVKSLSNRTIWSDLWQFSC